MNTRVSVHDKKVFLRWFLRKYQLKRRESVWILNYLINHENLLENVHFVREVKDCPRGMIITAQCSEAASFRFYKNHIMTTDAEKSFHDIRMNRLDPVYIQINFKNSHQSPEYAAVMEENPYDVQDTSLSLSELLSLEQLLENSLYETQRKLLLSKIDLALDNREHDLFLDYTKQLHILESKFSSKKKDKQL